ncbi:MAG: chaperone modulator CbpM [Cyclobacteriaceae bacterium]|nr:chaperone modulator CbpM [Cyclobacteriaceae bacterium]MDH4295543.1 chaperone modulator CbpM [Cyclobacteriaceae bacterium]MDH5247960.1 chaperone modulator CbpM [Cyclobacteriaceae bacterium]
MNKAELILLETLCSQYSVEMSFFTNLGDIGLIEIKTIEESHYIHSDQMTDIEKMIRMHRELDVNIEGIDVVWNLLKKIDALQNELIVLKNRLQRYED